MRAPAGKHGNRSAITMLTLGQPKHDGFAPKARTVSPAIAEHASQECARLKAELTDAYNDHNTTRLALADLGKQHAKLRAALEAAVTGMRSAAHGIAVLVSDPEFRGTQLFAHPGIAQQTDKLVSLANQSIAASERPINGLTTDQNARAALKVQP